MTISDDMKEVLNLICEHGIIPAIQDISSQCERNELDVDIALRRIVGMIRAYGDFMEMDGEPI